jgi:hypothetical protein
MPIALPRTLRCAVALTCACAAPTEPDRTEPATWLLTNLEASDDEVAAHVEHLDAWARPLGRDAALEDRVFSPAAPSDEALAGLIHAEGGPELTAIGAARWSPHDLEVHQELLGLTDRACVEAAERWTRTWTAGGDCFPDGVCDGATADEEVRWPLAESTFDYTATSRWRTVALVDDRRAMVGRSHLPAEATSARPGDRLVERYALQVWVEDPEDSGSTWRIDATWVSLTSDAAAPLTDLLLADLDAAWARQEQAIDDDVLDAPESCASTEISP